ncbi:hypothetical protein FPV67DRAFT_1471607 [Lyophyllum atratum]|nr:hypothetical protein FPV67DRAFT_1471607 [Lyophyllum atratum]
MHNRAHSQCLPSAIFALGLPTRPSRACTRSTASRRFSMPSMRRRDISASYQKRTSSLKSSTTKGSDLSSSSFPGNSSLRLVESTNDPDYPLPLSPKQSKYRMSNLPNTFAPLGSLSRHDHMTGIPPLPPLPVFRSTSAQQEHAIDTLKISQPYALTAGSNISLPFANKSASKIGRYSSHLASGMKVEQQDRSNARKPLSPVLGSNNLGAPSVSYPSAVYSTSSPKPHLESQTISPKVKQKTRRSSIRIRRSPAIGPSPLRAMILPDPSDASITIRNSVSQMGSRNLNTALDYSRLGFGFSSTPHTGISEFNNAVAPAQEQAKDRNKRASRLKEDEDDPNLLIGIIQELVDETSQWDKSLFKDKNFKAMIENSKHPSFRANQMPGKVLDKEILRRGDGIPEDESAEFDLSLLGLDIFRSDGETFIPSTEDKRQPGDAEGTDMVSFWDEKTWDDQEAKRAAVGVAC